MTKRTNRAPAQTTAPRILEDIRTTTPEVATPSLADEIARIRQEQADDAEIDEQIALPRSVVNRKYKLRYKQRARETGQRTKAAKRSAWDWLAQELAAATLTEKAKLRVDDFLALLDANGVDHSRWTNRAPGWEGRLRMTGRLALQRVVAESGILHFGDGEWKEAPAEWVAKYRND
jgi:hypothetical protein